MGTSEPRPETSATDTSHKVIWEIRRGLFEPPYTEPFVRWCGRSEGATPPPTRSLIYTFCSSMDTTTSGGESERAKVCIKVCNPHFKRPKPPAMPGNHLLLHNLTSDQEGLEAPKVRIRQDVLTVTTCDFVLID